jgi:hypothetical protein
MEWRMSAEPEIELLLILEERRRTGRPWMGCKALQAALLDRTGWRWGAGNLLGKKGGRALFLVRGATNSTEWSLSAAGVARARVEWVKRLKAG